MCENCDASVDSTGAFCWQCGVPLSTGREPFLPRPVPGSTPTSPAGGISVTGEASGRVGRRPGVARRGVAPTAHRRVTVGGALLLVAVGMLLASLLVSWYGISVTSVADQGGSTVTLTGADSLFPLNHVEIVVTCQGYAGCSLFNFSYGGTYAQSGQTNLGWLYGAIVGIVAGGAALGLAAALLSLSRYPGGAQLGRWLALVAVLFAVLAPTVLAVAQPPVLKMGAGTGGSSAGNEGAPSAATSFFGRCSGTACGPGSAAGDSSLWGPSIGWYLPLVGAVPLLVGALLTNRGPKERPLNPAYDPIG